jgi:hypothetical protein
VRTGGPRRLFALGVGLPAVGEVLATGPLNPLRLLTRPRVTDVPVAILNGRCCAINGSIAAAENTLDALPLEGSTKERLLPFGAALVGRGLDLAPGTAGLEAVLAGAERRRRLRAGGGRGQPAQRGAVPQPRGLCPLLVACVVPTHGQLFGEQRPAGRVPALLPSPSRR